MACENSLKKLCMLYPREWQCESVTIKTRKRCRRKFNPAPEGYHDDVTEVHHDEDHTKLHDLDAIDAMGGSDDDCGSFDLENMIKQKRDSEKQNRASARKMNGEEDSNTRK